MSTNLAPSRFLAGTDFAQYSGAVRSMVGKHFDAAREQHPARKVEYALALDAIQEHFDFSPIHTAVDVGGDGSPFKFMLKDQCGVLPVVVDPANGGRDLHQYLGDAPRLAQVITCLSVIEHVPDSEIQQFLVDLYTLLAPGGLLVLTMDAAPSALGTVADTYHFNWMRQRIYTAERLYNEVMTPLASLELRLSVPRSGGRSVCYDAVLPWVYDYAFASVVMVKPRRIR